MRIIRRFFFVGLVSLFLGGLLATSCDVKDSSLQISLTSSATNSAKIVSDGGSGEVTVRILETAIGNTAVATADTFASYNATGVLSPIFVVSMKNTSKGLLFAVDQGEGLTEVKNIDQMEIPNAPSTEATIPTDSQSFFINGNPAKIISTWITRGFGTATLGGQATSIGLVCQTSFDNLPKENILKEEKQDLLGGSSTTCSVGATKNLENGGWVAASSKTAIHLFFGGFNTGDDKFTDLGNGVDITNGLLTSEIKILSRNYSNSILKVKVEVVSSL